MMILLQLLRFIERFYHIIIPDLLPTNVLMKEKQKINQYFVPSNHHMWLHTILNYQLDDNGMRLNILNLKTVIDVYIEPSDIRVTKTNKKL